MRERERRKGLSVFAFVSIQLRERAGGLEERVLISI